MRGKRDKNKYPSSFMALMVCCSLFACPSELAGQDVKAYTSNLPFKMPEIRLPVFPDRTVNILDHGAVGDGQTMNTKAFAGAIRECAEAGGGRVIIPAGTWLTGPIKLESNIDLHLQRGALIMFSRKFEDYPVIPHPTEKSKNYRCSSLISGFRLENVAITGDGVIDGSGEAWRPVKKEKLTARQWRDLVASGGAVTADGKIWWPSAEAMKGEEFLRTLKKSKRPLTAWDFSGAREYLRPDMVEFYGCRRVVLDGPTFQNSPKFNVHPIQCEDLVVRNVKILNPWNAQNGDGLDIASCHNVLVYNALVDAGDDAICLKPGDVEEGRRWDMACENIVVADCIVYHGHGGFVIGSNTYGGARNVSVRNCTFIGTDVGLRFKSARNRGGLVENIYVDGIRMKGIPNEAILFDMYYGGDAPATDLSAGDKAAEAGGVTDRTPRFRKFRLSNIVCSGARRAVFLQGLPEMLARDIELTNVTISSKEGVLCKDVDGLEMTNITILSDQGPVFAVDNGRNITIKHASYRPGAELFLRVDGEESMNIRLLDTDISKAKKGIEPGRGAAARAVIQN